jgi:replicative DNA helicase
MDTRTGDRMTVAEACRRQDVELATLDSGYRLRTQSPIDYIDNGVRPCYRVTTYLGREIEVTINHPFLTLDGWAPLSRLKSGDRIAVPRALPFFGKASLSDAHVKLLAHLIAEGCLTRNLPYFFNADPEMQRDFSEAVEGAFPTLNAHWYPDGRNCSVSGGRRRSGYLQNPCTQWLRDHGLMGLKSEDKFVPEVIFNLPRRQIALFLNRLFSGDGYLQVRPTGQVTIDYASKSRRLIRDVQHLLLRFGINAVLRRLTTGHYRLYIQGAEPCKVFLSEIGLIGGSKKRCGFATAGPERHLLGCCQIHRADRRLSSL